MLSIGSIIKLNDYKLCVVGYTIADNDVTETSGYFVVPYPTGFTSLDKVFFIPFDIECEVVAEGYKHDASNQFMSVLAENMKLAETLSYSDLEEILKEYKKILPQKEKMK